MDRTQKEQVVDELAERLRAAESLIVADYRGLTNAQLATLRIELIEHGARFVVVKNTLTRRAAEAAGADALLALLEGPTAIAFVAADGDPAAVAKALAKSSKDTKILALRGGVLSGETMSGEEIERLATLPPLDILRGQVVGAIVAPLTQFAALLNAPLQNLVGLIDARIDQLGGAGEDGEPTTPVEASAADGGGEVEEASAEAAGPQDDQPAAEEAVVDEPAAGEPAADADAAEAPRDDQPAAEADPGEAAEDSAANDDQTEPAAAGSTDEEE